ncbi:hypothetical protein AC1031_005572 [Aphanomyces cochlioides]|nr:hypothetical protein AC1031_005572 [Aphanomyces cochlioides]
MGKVTRRDSDEGKQDAGQQEAARGAAKPEAVAKVDQEREKPKADETEIKEDPDLADKTEGKPSVALMPVATTGPFPMVQDLLLFAFAYFTPKRVNNDYEDRPTPRTVAQWTNRRANYAEFRWKTLSGPIRSGGFQRLAQACVLNAAAVTRKLPTLEAPYRQLPSTLIDKDGIPVRPDCSACPLGEERKRGPSHAAMERSQRPRGTSCVGSEVAKSSTVGESTSISWSGGSRWVSGVGTRSFGDARRRS